MAKKESKELKVESKEMTLEEARSFRASLYKPKKAELSVQDKREKFRIFWARTKKKYSSKTLGLEKILWMHLLATKHDEPEKFEKGLQHFGLKKIG